MATLLQENEGSTQTNLTLGITVYNIYIHVSVVYVLFLDLSLSRYDTVATGVVFFHRFFMMQSFKEFNRWVVAGACLLLAGKVEETPKQCRVSCL